MHDCHKILYVIAQRLVNDGYSGKTWKLVLEIVTSSFVVLGRWVKGQEKSQTQHT